VNTVQKQQERIGQFPHWRAASLVLHHAIAKCGRRSDLGFTTGIDGFDGRQQLREHGRAKACSGIPAWSGGETVSARAPVLRAVVVALHHVRERIRRFLVDLVQQLVGEPNDGLLFREAVRVQQSENT
jgi:hypothetical protein